VSLTGLNVPINELLYAPDSIPAQIELSVMEIVISEIVISASGVDAYQFHLRQQLSGGETHATQEYRTFAILPESENSSGFRRRRESICDLVRLATNGILTASTL